MPADPGAGQASTVARCADRISHAQYSYQPGALPRYVVGRATLPALCRRRHQLRGPSRFHCQHGTAPDAGSSRISTDTKAERYGAGTDQDCLYELGCNSGSSPKPFPPAVAPNVQSAGVPLKAGITSPLMMNLASFGSPVADHQPVFGQWWPVRVASSRTRVEAAGRRFFMAFPSLRGPPGAASVGRAHSQSNDCQQSTIAFREVFFWFFIPTWPHRGLLATPLGRITCCLPIWAISPVQSRARGDCPRSLGTGVIRIEDQPVGMRGGMQLGNTGRRSESPWET